MHVAMKLKHVYSYCQHQIYTLKFTMYTALKNIAKSLYTFK